MEYTTLGKTGLRVSVAGLGCGGFSRLGLSAGGTEADAVAVVRSALNLEVNLLDTAAAYGTETAVGKAIAAVPRDQVVVATKAIVGFGNDRVNPEHVVASLDNSLRALGTDYVDVFQLHGVSPRTYDYVRDEIAPALLREKAKGKFRHLGITETAPNDPEHTMLHRALQDDVWEVAMVAFHMMCQNARTSVFPLSRAGRVGTLLMFAVRRIFARPELLAETLRELAAAGQVPQSLAEMAEPLGFLIHEGGAETLTDAAYRFVRHEPGVERGAVRDRGSGPRARERRVDPEAAVARGGSPALGDAIRQASRRRPRRAGTAALSADATSRPRWRRRTPPNAVWSE